VRPKKNSLRTTWTPKKEGTAHSKRRQQPTSWHDNKTINKIRSCCRISRRNISA